MVVKRKSRKVPLPRRSWDLLSPALQQTRKRALDTLSMIRHGSTLSAAAKEIGVHPRTVTRHLGSVLAKRGGKYRAKSTDKISRSMVIYTQGRQLSITFADFKTASTIGQYLNAVRQYLNTGDKSTLKPFENVEVVDGRGIKHKLETDIRKIKAIESAKEEPEFFEIYRS
jgi:hypothetical protein